jgi:flavin-dependent dehydrogenase
MSTHHDVIVVGARAAGASTALVLARAGHRVLVIDPMRPGSDTLSTHALLRPAVHLLDSWGLLDEVARHSPAVDRVTFRYDDRPSVVELSSPLVAPRRTVLDRLLAEAAAAAGADVRYGVRATDLLRDDSGRVTGVRTDRGDEHASLVVGADGRGSLVARLVGAPTTRAGTNAAASVYAYHRGVDVDGYVWLFGNGVAGGLIPTGGGETCVFVSVPQDRFLAHHRRDIAGMHSSVLRQVSPWAAAVVEDGERVSRHRGFAGVPGRMRQPAGPGWALVGDSSHWKDPATAHGLSDAMRDAALLGAAVDRGLRGGDLDGALAAHATLRDELSTPFFDLTDRIASLTLPMDQLALAHRAIGHEVGRELAALRSVSGERVLVGA